MSDLVDREAVREFIKSYRHSTDVAFHMEDHLDEIPAASPWHRVEEQLPNFSGKVLVNIKPVVSCDSDRFETAYYNCLMSGDVAPKTFWQYDYEKDCIVDITKYVTHWMAVEPPKEDADGK